MALGSGSLAGYSRVAYEAVGLADFVNDNQRAARAYRDTTRDMTDEALRLELAQDKLRRSLQKGPNAYREQARAELQLRNAERQLRGETDSLTRSQQRNQAGLGSLRRSIVGLAAGYVGAQGLITLARTSVSAFREQELVAGQTAVAIETLGVDFDRYSGRLDRAIKQVQQLGFDDEELAKSFQLLAGSAKSPEQALDQLGLAADLARGRYIDLEAATQIVNKANLGMSGALRRIGIDVDKNATSFQLLEALQRRYGRSAEEAMDSGVAAADRFSVSVEQIQEVLGGGLAPALADVSDRVTEWVSKEENMEDVQRRVNEAVETGEQVVRGLADAFRIAHDAVDPLVEAVGGVENAVKIVTGLWVAFKVKALLGFGATAAASSATSKKMVADAAIAGRAWDIATRPRVMPVTVTGGGAGGAGRLARGLGLLGVTPGGAIAIAGAAAIYAGLRSGQKDAISPAEWAKLQQAARTGQITYDQISELELFIGDDRARTLRGLLARFNAKGSASSSPDNSGDARGPGAVAAENRARAQRARRRRQNASRFNFGDFERGITGLEEDSLDADATPGSADDLRIERRRLALAQRALREAELTRDQRMKVKAERNAALAEIGRIEAEEDQEAQAARDKAAAAKAAARAKAKAAQEKEEAAEEAAMRETMTRAERHYERMQKLTKGIDFSTRGGLRKAALRGVDASGRPKAAAGDGDKPLTEADIRRIHADFLTGLQGTTNQFGSNITPDGGGIGRVASHAAVQTDLLMEQNRLLDRLTRVAQHPGAKYTKTEAAVAFGGVAAI